MAHIGSMITDWYWDFGDGETSHLQSPYHVYRTPGFYTVSLTVTRSDGKVSKHTKTEYINVYGVAGMLFDIGNSTTPVCLVYGVDRSNHGGGWSTFSGERWVWPESPAAILEVPGPDANRLIVFDNATGLPFIINPNEGPNGIAPTPYRDMVGHPANPDGWPIATRVTTPSFVGENLHYRIQHEETYIDMTPIVAEYLPEMKVSCHLKENNEDILSTADIDVTLGREILFTNKNMADKIQIVVETSESGFRVNTIESSLKTDMKARYASVRESENISFQTAMMDALWWATRGSYARERIEGKPTGMVGTKITGPDGREESAVLLTKRFDIPMTLIGGHALLLWVKAGDHTAGETLAERNGWELRYLSPTGLSTVTAMEGSSVFDIRVFAGPIPDITEWFTVYADEVKDDGNRFLPLF